MSLAQKAAHGMAWVTLSTAIVRVLSLLTQIILARLLEPEDFGLVAIGLLAVNSMGLFRDLGFGAALIYKKDDENYTAANTAFIIIPIVATILFALAYISAPYIAQFFDNATVEPIVRLLALTFIISSFGTVPSVLLEKELEFKKKALPEVASRIGYAVVTIGLAFQGYGVWSLVYGQIASAVIMLILLWIVSDWRPTLSFDGKVAWEMFRYGGPIIVGAITIFLFTNIDDAIVGKLLGISFLGYYSLAYTISNFPATQITHLINRVMFPTYSILQDDEKTLRKVYLKTLKYVSMLSIPFSLGIFVIAPDFVNIILGEKWGPAIPALQILCFYGLLRSIGATTGSIFKATGNPKWIYKINILQLIVLLIFIYPAITTFDIAGVAAIVLISIGIGVLYALKKVKEILKLTTHDYFNAVKYPIIISIISIPSAAFSIRHVYETVDIIQLVCLIVLAVIIYMLLMFMLDRESIDELKNIGRSFL